MEQITRDEMIGLLRANRATVKDYQNGLFDAHVTPGGYVEPGEISSELEGCQKQIEQIDSAISALQAAEPVGYGLKGLLTKQWDGKTFVEKEDADSYEEVALLPLFALPCLPARAQIPEGWGIDIGELGEIVISAPDGEQDILYHDTPVMNEQLLYALLTASPASDHNGDGNEMVEVPFHKLALGTRFRYTSIPESEYVKISATQVARWQDDMAIAGWAGQGVYSFDEKDRTDTKVLVAVPIGLRQQEETER